MGRNEFEFLQIFICCNTSIHILGVGPAIETVVAGVAVGAGVAVEAVVIVAVAAVAIDAATGIEIGIGTEIVAGVKDVDHVVLIVKMTSVVNLREMLRNMILRRRKRLLKSWKPSAVRRKSIA